MNSFFLLHLFCAQWTILTFSCGSAAAEPLFLTPIIEANRLGQARFQPEVKSLYGDVESYSGYLTVNKTTDSHLFFWFFPGPGGLGNKNVPLVLWLGGGPGTTSLNSLFSGSGPIKVVLENDNATRLESAKYPWTSKYHMLYIDQPVGTGFSFTLNNGSVNSSEAAAEHLYTALDQFFFAFGHYDLYICGESYAGKYIPAVANRIHDANVSGKRRRPIQLKGLMIGNGLVDPVNMLDFDRVLQSAALINESAQMKLRAKQNLTRDAILNGNWTRGSDLLLEILQADLWEAVGPVNLFDYRRQGSEYFDYSFGHFLRQNKTREMIHVGDVPYVEFNPQIYGEFYDDIVQSARPWVEKLVQHYPILFFNGFYDIACAPLLTETFLNNMRWSGEKRFRETQSRLWRMGDRPIGDYKTVDNLTFAKIKDAGHSVTCDQPEVTRFMIDEFIGGKLRDTSTGANRTVETRV